MEKGLKRRKVLKIDYSITAAKSLQVEVCRKLIDDLTRHHGTNVISMSIFKERYPKVASKLHSFIDENIASALVTSVAMLKKSIYVVHCRFIGKIGNKFFEYHQEEKFFKHTILVPLCHDRTVTMTIMVKSGKTKDKTDVLVKVENGILTSDMIYDETYLFLQRLDHQGPLADAKVVYFYSRGPYDGQKMAFCQFDWFKYPTDSGNSPFKDYLFQIGQEIGRTLINADPNELGKLKVSLHLYSSRLPEDDPDLKEWDTCPCFSVDCSGAPEFFETQMVCDK